MTTRIGTSYFVNREAAISYYALQGEDEPAVSDKIASGLITIGKPAILLGERLLIIDNGRRYAIEFEERRNDVEREFSHVLAHQTQLWRAGARA
jgi:hypothetical protein